MAEDAISAHNREALMRCQVTLGELLARDFDRGLMTREQYEFALDLLANVEDYDEAEAEAQLTAWEAWREATKGVPE